MRVVLAFLLVGLTGCAMFDDYDYYGYDYVHDEAPTHGPVAAYGRAPYTPGRPSCGCSSGSANPGPAGIPPPPPPALPAPPPPSAYQPPGNIIPASASQSREPELLNR